MNGTPISIPFPSHPQRWAAGLTGNPGGLARSLAPKEPGSAVEYVITLPPSVGATAQEWPRNRKPATPSRSALVSEGCHRILMRVHRVRL